MDEQLAAVAEPILKSVSRYLPELPRVESPEDLVRAVERGLSQAISTERAGAWHGLLGKEVLYPHPSGVSFWIRLGDGISMYAIRSDRDDAATRYVLSKLTPGGTFFDVGSNTGWFALRASAAYRKMGGGTVHAFEPQPVMANLINRSIRENELEGILNLHNMALGNKEGTMWMSTPPYNSGGATIRDRAAKADSFEVQVNTLDSLDPQADRIDVMKVDIEGAEPLFVEGATAFLRKYRPTIYSELHPTKLEWISKRTREDYLNQMESLGYKTFLLDQEGRPAPLDRTMLKDKARLLDVVFEPLPA